MIRKAVLASVVVVALIGAPRVAQAQAPGASISDSTVEDGDTATVTVTGCTGFNTIDLILDGELVRSAVVDSSGIAEADLVLTGSPGAHTIANTCNQAELSFTITTSASGTLPRSDIATTTAAPESFDPIGSSPSSSDADNSSDGSAATFALGALAATVAIGAIGAAFILGRRTRTTSGP